SLPPLPLQSFPSFPGLAARSHSFFPLFLTFLGSSVLVLANPTDQASLTATILSTPPSVAIPNRKSYFSTSATPTTPTTFAITSFSAPPAIARDNEVEFALESPPNSTACEIAAPSGPCHQMVQKTTAAIVTLSSLIAYVTINSILRTVRPSAFIWYDEDRDEESWIASSPSWFDRKACRWLGLCGTAHFRVIGPHFGRRTASPELPDDSRSWQNYWTNETGPSEDSWDATERSLRQIPDYVLEYAPLVHLFSGEQFWPCDIAEHLYHTTPMLNYTPVQSEYDHPSLQDLDELNQWEGGRHVFLTSNDDVEGRPPWIEGEKNVPTPPEDNPEDLWLDRGSEGDESFPEEPTEDRVKWYDTELPLRDGAADGIPAEELGYPTFDQDLIRNELRRRYGGEPIIQGTGGRSEAPAVLLVIDKGNGIVDAFWFYFYSFNLGNAVFNVRFGNHIGDWEHCLVRFHHGKPKALFFSAHSAGEAYSYEAVEKIGRRPVIYSATGTHAMYATPGVHPYILPWGLLHDQTDRGPLWDPLLNSHSYTYDVANDTLRASTLNPASPTEWFYFKGQWGDKFYQLGDRRQYRFAGQYHYVNGPLGPWFKHLNRRKVCQGPDEDPCLIKDYIGE
ncbi:hypothetical protein ARAM_003812, partial [Aspergillus rambellii]